MLLRYWPQKLNIRFMSACWIMFFTSMILTTAAFALIAARGLNFGVDFAGGSVIEIGSTATTSQEAVRAAVEPLGLAAEVTQASVSNSGDPIYVIKVGALKDKAKLDQLVTETDPEKQAEAAQEAATQLVKDAVLKAFPGVEIRSTSTVGPKVSGELFLSGMLALGVSMVMMLIYIAFRFEWVFSVGAVAALIHDIILTVGMLSLFQMEFNLTTIAALLTIVGYSINDSVVVFDRVREDRRKYKKMSDRDIIDMALNATLSRTMLTGGTALLSLLAIYLFGGPVLEGMALTLIFGVAVGTYSSVFVASVVVLFLGISFHKVPPPTHAPGEAVV